MAPNVGLCLPVFGALVVEGWSLPLYVSFFQYEMKFSVKKEIFLLTDDV